jgi:hypothetical protein
MWHISKKDEVARANYERKLDNAHSSCAPLCNVKVHTLYYIFGLIKFERCTVERKLKVGVYMIATKTIIFSLYI